MTPVQAMPESVIDDDVFKVVDSFEKTGNWTEERHEILEKLSMEEIAADIMRIQAEHPERYLTPEEFREKIRRMKEEQHVGRRVEMVGA